MDRAAETRNVYLNRGFYRIYHRTNNSVTRQDVEAMYTPVVIRLVLRLSRPVARGEYSPFWNTPDKRIFLSLMGAAVAPETRRVMRTADRMLDAHMRRAYGSTAAHYYTASRFMGAVERQTLLREGEAAHPDGLRVQLRPYQLRTLHFCLDRERSGVDLLMWKPVRPGLFWSPVTERFSDRADLRIRGGFVFEEMGMGKTVEMLALHLSNPPPADWDEGGTLVVCPVALVAQWEEEARRVLEDPGTILIHHGPRRSRDASQIRRARLVLTTYGILSQSTCALHGVRWHRVIFDESHVARRSTTVRWKRCVQDTDATHRWAVTGTPLVNGTLNELYNQTRMVCPGLQIRSSAIHWSNRGFLFLLSHIATRFSKHMRIAGGACWSCRT